MARFDIEMLPALHGDALWVEYSAGARTRRMLIDGGPVRAYAALERRMQALPDGDRRVELVVVSHVDTDHIEGLIRLMAAPRKDWPILPKDIWFNGFRHVSRHPVLGGREGEFLSALIHQRAYEDWNAAFGRDAVMVPDDGPLPRVELADGMVLTLLSPDSAMLQRMAERWEKDVAKWQILPGDLEAAWAQLVEVNRFHPDAELTLGPNDLSQALLDQLRGQDGSAANGSSIAFLAQFGGKSCLFLADADMRTVCPALRRLVGDAGVLKVDAVKLSHHGSRNNLTQEFMSLVDAEHVLFSTNGDQHGHPDDAAVQAVIVGSRRKPTLWFNYRSPSTERFEAESLGAAARYSTRYPAAGEEGIVVSL
jgi:beta-lactamase superfamily II metal-dependent hydrolase